MHAYEEGTRLLCIRPVIHRLRLKIHLCQKRKAKEDDEDEEEEEEEEEATRRRNVAASSTPWVSSSSRDPNAPHPRAVAAHRARRRLENNGRTVAKLQLRGNEQVGGQRCQVRALVDDLWNCIAVANIAPDRSPLSFHG